MMAIENPVHYQLPVLEDAISPTELHELLSLINPEPECGPTTRSTSSSETNRSAYSNEERKRRRMISNRESARRSRWRKKKHQEDLGDEINRLKHENRELENRLFVLTHQCHSVERDSDRLLYELVYLQHRLAGLQETLAASTMMMQ